MLPDYFGCNDGHPVNRNRNECRGTNKKVYGVGSHFSNLRTQFFVSCLDVIATKFGGACRNYNTHLDLTVMRSIIALVFATMALSLNGFPQSPSEMAEIWSREHVTKMLPSDVRHRDLVNYIQELGFAGIAVEKVGLSQLGREIYQIEWGEGPLKVFLWSQMHGDEPTATSALIDLFAILQRHRNSDWAKKIASAMTIRAVPMLNPDGADLYQRRSIFGIDINRDARSLLTREAQLLKRLRDEWQPALGFNLHNQNALTTVADTPRQAAISFLVVFGDEKKTLTPGLERNKRLVAAMYAALVEFIPGHIGRYPDEWTPTAFGDSFSAWGTPVILIETGELYGKSEMFLVKMNFVAILTALKVLAEAAEKEFDPAIYNAIPPNTNGRLFNYVFRRAMLVDRMKPQNAAVRDLALVSERRRAGFVRSTIIRRIGNLTDSFALEDYDASGFIITTRFQPLATGSFGELIFYRRDRKIDWASKDLEAEYPPDAIFSLGRWTKGEGLVPKLKNP